MSKNVWMINHYAANPVLNKNGRHYWFSNYLNEKNFRVKIISASTIHHKNINLIQSKRKFKTIDEKPYLVLIKTNTYTKNNLFRVLNIINFYKNLLKTYKQFDDEIGKPDIIYASSAHPLALIAGIKIARYYKIPCISEVRDLWPESIVSYGLISNKNILTKLMYKIEKKIYYKSDQLIFTMPGAKKYLSERQLLKNTGGKIEDQKVNILNNGVDLNSFKNNLEKYPFKDKILDNENYFKIVYTGSIKKANKHLWELIKAAQRLNTNQNKDIQILIFGEGSERLRLEEYCKENNISNLIFKGYVKSEYIPSILSKSDVNVLNCKPKEILKYGGSQNKLFQYIASAKPIITAEDSEFSIIKNINGGIAKAFKNEKELSESIIELKNMSSIENKKIKDNLKRTSKEYDYKLMTDELINIFTKAENSKSIKCKSF